MKIISLLLFISLSSFARSNDKKAAPNFILIFMDDLGYADLSSYGSQKISTPSIDRLAKEGMKFSSFMVASPVCTPSRAALLTGCYPKRISMANGVLFPNAKKGLNPNEVTMADHLSSAGYKTACIGKWHLGDSPEVLPAKHGFDYYYGIPYSNDMSPSKGRNQYRKVTDVALMNQYWNKPEEYLNLWKVPLYENSTIVEENVDQRTISKRYTDKSLEFIEKNAKEGNSFFLYLAHSMPHIPLFVPDEVLDSNPKNAYKNTIEYLDSEVGRVIDKVVRLGIEQNTYIIFTSDNGPWLRFKNFAGLAHPLRDGKGTNFEGGQRVPFIIWGPGKIKSGTVSHRLSSSMDLLPSLASLSGNKLEIKTIIDGQDISDVFLSKREVQEKPFLYYSSRGEIKGIRQGDYKLSLVKPKQNGVNALYNLQEDISEKTDISEQNPELVEKLSGLMYELDEKIAKEQRPSWKK